MKVLRARLMDKIQQEHRDEIDSHRKSLVGTGDRSERIRTYNFPQGRVTDHRIGLTLHKLDLVLDGQIDEIIEALIAADQAEMLKELNEQLKNTVSNVRDAVLWAASFLAGKGVENSRLEAELLMAKAMGKNRVAVLASFRDSLPEAVLGVFAFGEKTR